MKRCLLTILTIRKMQIRTMMRFHHSSVWTATVGKENNVCKGVKILELLCIVDENAKSCSHYENGTRSPQKIKNKAGHSDICI